MTIRESLYKLLVKLVGSRKSFYNMLGKVESWTLIILLTLDILPLGIVKYIVLVYFIEQIRTMSYMNILLFEKIKIEASIKK